MYCFMRCTLGKAPLLFGHTRIFVSIPADIFAGKELIPDASSRITAIDVVQMIAVTAERIA
jgi:hypothetical protein